MIRPAAMANIKRWGELALVAGIALLGAYLAYLGGYILLPLGGAMMAACLPMALLAYRRLRFAQTSLGAGMIEVVEGELRYFAPPQPQIIGAAPLPTMAMGGYLNLPDLAELRLMTLDQRRFWRLKTTDGQALMVPVDAAGHGALFDVFAALPQINSAALIAALNQPAATADSALVIWRRNSP